MIIYDSWNEIIYIIRHSFLFFTFDTFPNLPADWNTFKCSVTFTLKSGHGINERESIELKLWVIDRYYWSLSPECNTLYCLSLQLSSDDPQAASHIMRTGQHVLLHDGRTETDDSDRFPSASSEQVRRCHRWEGVTCSLQEQKENVGLYLEMWTESSRSAWSIYTILSILSQKLPIDTTDINTRAHAPSQHVALGGDSHNKNNVVHRRHIVLSSSNFPHSVTSLMKFWLPFNGKEINQTIVRSNLFHTRA